MVAVGSRDSVATESAQLSLKVLADSSVLLKGPRGEAHLARLGPGVWLYTCQGQLSEAFYEPMVAPAQREIASNGRLTMFVDGWLLTSVDTGFREQWTEWFKANKQRFHMQLLVRTKLMDMAASLANLFTGVNVIKTYSNIANWELACRRDFPSFRRMPDGTG